MKKIIFIAAAFFLSFSFSAAALQELPEPVALMQQCQKSYEALTDYTAIFIKEQRLRGRLRKPETTSMKFKKPFSLYMKWIKQPDEGKEVIYVQGENEGKLLAHPGGLLQLLTPTTVRLEPTHPLARGGNLKPITAAGLGNMIEALVSIFTLAQEKGDLKAVCKEKKEYEGRAVYVIERFLPEKEEYPNQYAVIYVDAELLLPVFYAAYDKEKNLLEKYEYQELKVNVGLTAEDFDKSNPKYKYPLF